MAHGVHHNLDEKFEFTSKAKRTLYIILGLGVVLLALGVFMNMGDGHGAHGTEKVEIFTDAAPRSPGEELLFKKEKEREAQYSKDGEFGDASGEYMGEGTGKQSTGDQANVKAETAHAEGGGHHGSPSWLKRLYANLWINNVFFGGLSIIGLFFFAIQYVARAGWSTGIIRVMMSMASWLPIAGVLMIILFFIAGHDIFHWTHSYLFESGNPGFDPIINGKKGFFYFPLDPSTGGNFPVFFLLRMVIFFVVWYLFYLALRKHSLAEDLDGDVKHYHRNVVLSTLFIIFFGVSSSVAAWDWVMSIDTHWFSTMFGWYNFASWFVSGLATITLIVVFLKDNGYLKIVNNNHLHDLGKFIFAFTIFWTYVWFSQFMLIFYANIPEETVYFMDRLRSPNYVHLFYINLILNFFFPFLVLMTRDSKRQSVFLKIACGVILIGHWLDFYLMITPGTLREEGGIGFMEIGLTAIFASAFLLTVLNSLSKVPLIAKKHPMLEESLHHHI